MNYVREYYDRISSGDIITSRRVKAVYERLIQEMGDKCSPYYFDEEAGERPILFIETFCKQSQGSIGAPLRLELFQKAYIQLLFGWLEKETGYRRFRETMFLCGRKNGKSTLLSGIALYMLIADYEGAAEIYSVATKKDQAKKVLTEAVNMVKQSPELRAVVKKRRNDIYFPATSSIFEALASDSNTLDGLNSHAVIIDELHAIRDRNLYEVMKQSTSSRRQPLVVMITTAGTVRECIFDNMYELSCDLADGKKKDDTFLPILYELDARDEWTNPQMWIKANPGLGKIKQYKTLANFVERAKNSPADLPGVLCKDFNIRENESNAWLSFEQIKNSATFDISEVYNTYAIGGCDLSATTDLTAATLLIRKPNDPTVYVLQQYFLPRARIEKLEEKNTNEAPYRLWAERGLLTVCEGNRVNYESIDLGDTKDNLANAVIETEKAIKTIKKATDRLESHIKRTDERIALEVLHIVENEKELYARIELTEDAITSEVSRATEAEGKLSSRITQTADSITAEVTRATNAEAELSGKIELTAESLTTTFESKVKEETDRAEAVEKELSSTITQTAESITTEITAKITTETERAEKKEEELSSRITQTADSITAEVTRATNAEAELSGKIELTAESLTTTFESKVKEETDRAEAAEKELSSTITQTAESLTSTFTATITETAETLTGKIDEEAARAGKAEETLTSTISQTAEEIATEVSRATEAEGELSSRITQTADSITAEVTRATNAESNLSTKITQTVNAIRLSVSSKESGDETETTVSITNGTTTLNSVKITGTTAKQAAAIIADSVKGITLSYTSTTSNNQTTSTLTLKNGSATLGTATVVGTTATQAATIAADAVKGITLTVSNSTTGASSTLTLKSGSTTLSSGTIEFTGLVTFSNLTDGKTQISGNNITTGKISADRIDVSTLYVDRVYSGTTASRQVVLQANGTTSLIVGGNGSSTTGNVTTTNLLASSTIVIGRYVSSYSNNQYNLMFDVNNHVMYPNHTSPMYAWSLGSSQHWFNELYAVNVHLGNNTTAAKIGFFGATPQAKKTGISTLDGLITALKGYGLIG